MRSWVNRWPLLLVAIGLVAWGVSWLSYPSDRTPEGAYLRVMSAVNQGRPERFFAYLETAAQHACFTIGEYGTRSRELIEADYPPEIRQAELKRLGVAALPSDGPEVFAFYARQRGWLDQLRKDMSGIRDIEVSGPRASVETARGTRYPFRVRQNGIWGLTQFTPALVDEAERAARNVKLIESAAADYRKAGAAQDAPGSGP